MREGEKATVAARVVEVEVESVDDGCFFLRE